MTMRSNTMRACSTKYDVMKSTSVDAPIVIMNSVISTATMSGAMSRFSRIKDASNWSSNICPIFSPKIKLYTLSAKNDE